jgi:hypothetical protein
MVNILQPSQGTTLTIGQENPVPAVLKTDQAVLKKEQILLLYRNRSKPCGCDIHVFTHITKSTPSAGIHSHATRVAYLPPGMLPDTRRNDSRLPKHQTVWNHRHG